MRSFVVLLLVFVAPAVFAQPCDPVTTDEVCPDTTDWQRYVPLDLGNVWQYEDARFTGEPVTFSSWAIVGQAEVDGLAYVEFERCNEADDGSASCDEPLLLRYDDEHELLLRRTDDGDVWWDVLPCDLGAAFNTGTSFDAPHECTGPAEGFVHVALGGAYGAIVEVPPDEVAGDTRKSFEMYPGTGPELYAGLGVTSYFYDLVAEPMRLVYANVGGEQVGAPAFASCDPADADPFVACPDTTDWRRYFPLDVGNEWQYREVLGTGETVYWGRRVSGTVELEGRTYFNLERCEDGAEEVVSCGQPTFVRYSDEQPTLVRYTDEGEVAWGTCLLDIPFGGFPTTESGFYECEDSGPNGPVYLGAWGSYGASISIGADVVSNDTRKSVGTPIFTTTTFFAGLGPIEFEDELHPEATQLIHARVDGVGYGTPAFPFPTLSEPETVQPVATGFTAAFPNPARGAMQAQYTLAEPQTVTLELIDLLGRRVRETDLGLRARGPHDLQIDLRGLRPGLYVLRLLGDAGAEATKRVVVQ